MKGLYYAKIGWRLGAGRGGDPCTPSTPLLIGAKKCFGDVVSDFFFVRPRLLSELFTNYMGLREPVDGTEANF